jgi:cell division protein FtsB
VGIYYAPSALFVIAFGFILVLLLHFSIAVSRLADQSKVLAQRVALLEERNKKLAQEVAERRDEEHAGTARNFARPMSGAGRR